MTSTAGTPDAAEELADQAAPLDALLVDAALGTLPGFSLIDPEATQASEESPQDIALGATYAATVVALALLYPLCDRYRAYKQAHPDGWPRYV